MHDDRSLVEQRIRRELWERVLPLVHRDRRALSIEAGPDPARLSSFAPGTAWGAPWTTTWFRLRGEIPPGWAGERVEAVIDPGFTRAAAGFQCEALVVEAGDDGRWRPVQGIHPNRTNVAVASDPGPVELLVEAAANPSFPEFYPSHLGSRATAGEEPQYRFRTAHLVVVDHAAEALAHDVDVLDGLMRSLAVADPRRARLLGAIEAALDALPDVGRARAVLVPHLADAGTVGRHRIVATGHAHIDTAWLWPASETVRKCTRTFSSVVGMMDEYPDFRFTCSQAQQYAWIERNHPELFEAIRAHAAAGRWIPVGGMWVEADMNLPSGESLARQIVHGQRYFERYFGRRCTEVWIPDVFGYPAGLPQLFAAGGMTRFVTQKLSWNKQNRFPHHTFWWEGLDGTRVLTHFPPVDTYNAEVTPEEVGRSMAGFLDHRWSGASLLPFGYGDGGGGPTREMLERARRLAVADSRAIVELGSPADFFELVEREALDGADVPVWRGELYFETHRGTLTSQLRTKLGNRRCERLLVEAELWAAAGGRAAGVDDLWREVLTQQFHDILPGSSIRWVHDDAEEVFDRVGADLERRIEDSLQSVVPAGTWLANAADAPIDEVVVTAGDALDGVEHESGTTQRLADGRAAFRATVPPFGVAPVAPQPVEDRVVLTETSMTNAHLAVRWNPAGELISVIDIDHSREVVPVDERVARLELAVDQPVEYDAWDLEAWTHRNAAPVEGPAEIEVLDRGPLVGRTRVTRRFGPSTAIVEFELLAGSRQLGIRVEVDWQHRERLLTMVFPLDVRADTAACDVQFGVVHRPTHASSPWDAAKFEVCAHRFVDLSEPSFGVAVLNDGRYGHNVFGGAVRVSLARAPQYPDPDADRGRHEVTLAIRPHAAGLAEVRAAASVMNRPLRVVRGGSASTSPRPVVAVTGDDGAPAAGVAVDAVKFADDGSGDLIVRLHEALGDRVRVSVGADRPIADAWRCDLLEDPVAGEEVGDDIVAFTLRPFELVTLRLAT